VGSDILFEDILAVEKNFAFQARAAHGFVHAVQRAEKSGLAATRRPDERRDPVGSDAQVDVKEGLLGAVKEIDLGDGHAHGESRE
jgi:hypothetical protein